MMYFLNQTFMDIFQFSRTLMSLTRNTFAVAWQQFSEHIKTLGSSGSTYSPENTEFQKNMNAVIETRGSEICKKILKGKSFAHRICITLKVAAICIITQHVMAVSSLPIINVLHFVQTMNNFSLKRYRWHIKIYWYFNYMPCKISIKTNIREKNLRNNKFLSNHAISKD